MDGEKMDIDRDEAIGALIELCDIHAVETEIREDMMNNAMRGYYRRYRVDLISPARKKEVFAKMREGKVLDAKDILQREKEGRPWGQEPMMEESKYGEEASIGISEGQIRDGVAVLNGVIAKSFAPSFKANEEAALNAVRRAEKAAEIESDDGEPEVPGEEIAE
ncbi:MAG: hypothetical protein FWC68_03045 [Oscillospiraceae bacterium]|nr:hypothetical protein [Oscillospiraceae bacterium]